MQSLLATPPPLKSTLHSLLHTIFGKVVLGHVTQLILPLEFSENKALVLSWTVWFSLNPTPPSLSSFSTHYIHERPHGKNWIYWETNALYIMLDECVDSQFIGNLIQEHVNLCLSHIFWDCSHPWMGVKFA